MFMLCVAAMAQQFFAQVPEQGAGREMFVDTAFERGLTLTAASHPAPKIEIGVLQTTDKPSKETPAWRIAQWASRFLLEPGICTKSGENTWTAETPGKRVVVERTKGVADVLLDVRGGVEYDGKMRTQGEAWPHLLVEQSWQPNLRLDTLKQLKFNIEMRIPHCSPAPGTADKITPGLHAAQVSAFWTVHNKTEGNPDYNDMIWFGIPFFDARHDIPPPNYALDFGKDDASGKFICLLDGKRFYTGRTGDGQWHKVEADLVDLLKEALTISQKHGHLKNTRFEDLAITSFNLGWEIPGPYDAAFEFRGLSMKAFNK